MQLRGSAAKGYAFDRFYGAERTSDAIYDDCVKHLVDSLFRVGLMVVVGQEAKQRYHCSVCISQQERASPDNTCTCASRPPPALLHFLCIN
jgi:hypothetical protein